jgi:predicted acetyltransferase
MGHPAANVQVVEARDRASEAVLSCLFQLYAYDFSELLGIDVEEDGRFRIPPVAIYWTDPRCHPYLIRVEGKPAGFALVQQRSRLSGDEGVCDLAEFFVLRKYRRRGVGEVAAAWIFDRFRGPWEVREKDENQAGTAFWRKVIGRYTAGRFDEERLDDARWRGPVQRFDSARSA